MSWLRNHKNTVYRAGIGIAAVSLIGFIWTGAGLYRQRKAIEAEIAARNYTAESGGQQNDTYLFSGDIVEYNGKNTGAIAM